MRSQSSFRVATTHSTEREKSSDNGRWEEEARRYREVHDRSPDGMMIFRSVRDEHAKIVDFEWIYCNRSASQIVGRPADELLGKRLLVEMPGNEEEGLFALYVGVVETGEPHSHEFSYRHEGIDSWFRSTSVRLGDGFYVAFSDLTVRKRAEDQATRLAAIVDFSDHAIFSTSNTSTVETWNHGAEQLLGYSTEEMVGQSILRTIPEQCRLEHETALQRILEKGGVESLHTIRLTKNGDLIPVSITLSPISDWSGNRVGMAIIARDIFEEVAMQEQLLVADRMASVGTLAAGMAHEINSPLACVTANLDIMIEELRGARAELPSGRFKDWEALTAEARSGAERIRKIVRGLLTFARGEEERRTVIDVRPVLEIAIDLAFNEIRDRARLVKSYGETPLVLADDARLAQVFINLLVNAAQSIEIGAPETNEVRVTTSTDAYGRAVVEVRDTGPGIPPHVVSRLFEPFFTTKTVGAGTGLGLSICHNIVIGMGGEITVASQEGLGTTFSVVLPAAAREVAVDARKTAQPERDQAVDKAAAAAGQPQRRGAVLVVDDEPAVGVVLARVLRDHDVTVVTRAKAALALLASGKSFDVILSDIMMPEMSGIEFYEELLRAHPEAIERLVFLSGGGTIRETQAFLRRITNERLDKPFNTAVLRALVRRFTQGP